jgi:hypothetical protein
MTNIFIGGSRKIARLTQPVQQRLDNIINNNFIVLVGDASGVDLQIQKYLFAQNYTNVIVFCTGDRCRNNVGQWETRTVETDKRSKGFSFYALKDLQMAKEATYGFMIWDAKSKGTLNNVLNLLRLEKKILVYLAPTQSFQTVRTADDLHNLLAMCERQDVVGFEQELSLQQFFTAMRPQLAFNLVESDVAPEKVVAL